MKLRGWVKRTPAGRLFWRVFIGVLGAGITVLGLITLVTPGPGLLVLLAGLGILATEFAWAARVMEKTKSAAKSVSEKAGVPLWIKYFIIAGATIAGILVVLIYYWR